MDLEIEEEALRGYRENAKEERVKKSQIKVL